MHPNEISVFEFFLSQFFHYSFCHFAHWSIKLKKRVYDPWQDVFVHERNAHCVVSNACIHGFCIFTVYLYIREITCNLLPLSKELEERKFKAHLTTK